MLNKEEDREIHCTQDRPGVQDESSTERNEGKERPCGPRPDGWMEGSGMLCHLVERAV